MIRSAKKFVETASDISRQFGFMSIDEFLELFPQQRNPLKAKRKKTGELDKDALVSVLHHAYSRNLHLEDEVYPHLIFHNTIEEKSRQSLFPFTRKPLPVQFSLTVLNIKEGFSEALVLTCLHRILKETGLTNDDTVVRIGSIGDTASFDKFMNSAQRVSARNEKKIPERYRELMKSDFIRFYNEIRADEECREFVEILPKPISFLTQNGQDHFQNVLDCIKEQDLIFQVEDSFLGNNSVYSHTIMSIDSPEGVNVSGGRYDALSKSVMRTAIPTVSMSITFEQKETAKKFKCYPKRRDTNVYVVHAGGESRMRALQVIDSMCERRVCVEHRIFLPTVCEQLDDGGGRSFPYLLIVGHQEILEGQACLRNKRRDTLEKVDFPKLCNRIKRIK